jgi:hypothetical protein
MVCILCSLIAMAAISACRGQAKDAEGKTLRGLEKVTGLQEGSDLTRGAKRLPVFTI